MDGTINLENVLRLNNDLFSSVEYVPFNNLGDSGIRFVDEVAFCHAPRNRAGIISSKYITNRALTESFSTSVVFGHTHRFIIDSLARVDQSGQPVITQAINGGCFFTRTPQYAVNNTNDWWAGVLLLTIDGSTIDIATRSLKSMQ
jgi:hypothetical protein